jgi:flagellar biosynthetic protein FliR
MNTQPLALEAARLALETVRIAGVVMAAPLIWTQAPVRVRAALVVLLGLVCHGSASVAQVPLDSIARIAVVAPTELLVGVAMGFVVRLAIATAEMAGDIASPLLGLGAASLFDPHVQSNDTGLTVVLRQLVLLLSLLLGVHRVLIGSLLASFEVVPLGAFINPGLCAPDLVRMSAATIASGVRLALPLVAALLLIQLGLAFLSRAAPSLQIFSIGFAVMLVAGTVVFLASLPELAREIEVTLSGVSERLETVLGAMYQDGR